MSRPTSEPADVAHLHRDLGLKDVVLLFVTTGTNLQWVATAAAAGPSALPVWVVGGLLMFVPLSICVVDLSSRYPEEGGLYVWSRRAFGPFAGFITGWTYWCSNLPYFPGLLYFTAGNALFIGGGRWDALSGSPAYFIAVSLLGLGIATYMNVRGLGVGKWLNNVGAITRVLTTSILVGLGVVAWWRFGSATTLDVQSMWPRFGLQNLIFWSSIAFAWTGPESAPFMAGEIQKPRRTIPRALAVAAPIIAAIYILGTWSVLAALPPGEATGLQGVLQAVQKAGARVGVPALAPIAAVLMTITCLGSVGAWLQTVARIPFVAGIDHYLPEGFARLHPRWGSPYVAILTQSLVTVVLVFVGQAGTSVHGAYDVLLSMTFVITFIPFLFIFAAAIKLHVEPPAPEELHLPGGKPTIVLCASVGFVTTAACLVLGLFPAADEPHKALAVAKIVGLTLVVLLSGAAAFVLGARRAARSKVAASR